MSISPEIPTKNVTELSRVEMGELFQALGEPAFRAKQLYDWVHKKGVRSFDEMTNFSNHLRERLKSEGYTISQRNLQESRALSVRHAISQTPKYYLLHLNMLTLLKHLLEHLSEVEHLPIRH